MSILLVKMRTILNLIGGVLFVSFMLLLVFLAAISSPNVSEEAKKEFITKYMGE